jgi:hypothetical protein
MKVIDAIKFILKNRKGKAFVDWSIPQMTIYIVHCIDKNTFFWSENEKHEVTGVCVGHLFDGGYHIDNILSIEHNMPGFIHAIVKNHPHITKITTLRHGRFYKEYPVNQRTLERFMKGTK